MIAASTRRMIWLRHTAAAGVALALLAGGVAAQGDAPFDQLAGHWSGVGAIELSNGGREPVKCRATYDVLGQQNNLQFNIRCASDSFKFDLRGSASYSGGAVTGSWSEATRNASGTMTGKATSERLEVVVEGPAFSATLTLVTQGAKQMVSIKSHAEQGDVKGAAIALRRI